MTILLNAPGFEGFSLDCANIAALPAQHDGMMLVLIDHQPFLIPILPLDALANADEYATSVMDCATGWSGPPFDLMLACVISNACVEVAQSRTSKRARKHHNKAAHCAQMYSIVSGNQFAVVEHNTHTKATTVEPLPVRNVDDLQAWLNARLTTVKPGSTRPVVGGH